MYLMANSEDPNEMPQAFHLGLLCLLHLLAKWRRSIFKLSLVGQ